MDSGGWCAGVRKQRTTMGPIADAFNSETSVQHCGCRRVELEIEDYVADYTGFEDGPDKNLRRAITGVSVNAPVGIFRKSGIFILTGRLVRLIAYHCVPL